MYDIYYISKKKTNHFFQLKQKFSLIKHVTLFQEAQERCLTEFFWIIWDDIIVEKDFNFDYTPDNWSKDYVHVFLNNDSFDGIVLCPTHKNFSNKEIDYRFFTNKKEIKILASNPKPYDVFEIDNYDHYLLALEKSTTEMFWGKLRPITIKDESVFDLYFTHDNVYDRTQNHAFLHDINGETKYDGLYLFSKHKPVSKKEIEHKFIIDRKEWNIVASEPKLYDVFEIDTYDEYLSALETSTTEMFWISSRNIAAAIPDLFFNDRDNAHFYERSENHAFIHQVGDQQLYNGLFLCSTHKPLTEREVEHRHIVNRKEWDVVASGPKQYNIFEIDTYDEYLSAFETSTTEMFWIIPNYVSISKRFNFDVYFSHDQSYERSINHVYLNGKYHDGIVLCSKYSKFSKREFDYRFISHKKEWPVIISTPKPYDLVFISYQEPNADENYNRLLKKYPSAKRVHGVKGIHQAHIAAAKLCNTDMFWIIDGDAVLVDDFDFDYQVARWDKETVHVWRSQNPVNGLVYGYGGVKLFPRQMTLDMDVSKPDMTTSISSKFKAVHEISNITAFNSDPLSTWRSAFRECAKLSSKVIDRQKDDETQRRLSIWCTVGADQPYGNYAIDGARSGSVYGTTHQHNKEKLAMINNFEWLEEQFNARNL